MPEGDELPTIGELVSNWLGVQLPAIPMKQTLKNFDKALSKIVLAAGENFEARIKRNTGKAKAQGKIDVEGMYRTEDERRKIENRAAATKAALEDLRHSTPQEDAPREIEDDWLNYFARLAEDKSSEELQTLFGKILSGEIKRPGSFSLTTMQTLALISKRDAELLSKLLSFAIAGTLVPFETAEDAEDGHPTVAERVFLDELGIAGHPSQIGGLKFDFTVGPSSRVFLLAAGHRGMVVVNDMPEPASFSIPGQVLTNTGQQILAIANSPPTDIEFLKKVARNIRADLMSRYQAQISDGLLKVQVGEAQQLGTQAQFTAHFTIED